MSKCCLVACLLIFISGCNSLRYQKDIDLPLKAHCFRMNELSHSAKWIGLSEKDVTSGFQATSSYTDTQLVKMALGRVNAFYLAGDGAYWGQLFEVPEPSPYQVTTFCDEKASTLIESEFERQTPNIGAYINVAHSVSSEIASFEKKEKDSNDQATKPQTPSAKIDITIKDTTPKQAGSRKSNSDFTVVDANVMITSSLYSLQPSDRIEQIASIITPIAPGVEVLGLSKAFEVKKIAIGTEVDTSNFNLTGPLGFNETQPIGLTADLTQQVTRNLAKQYATKVVHVPPARNIVLASLDGGPQEADVSGHIETGIRLSLPTRLCKYIDIVTNAETPDSLDNFEFERICFIDKVDAIHGSIVVVRRVSTTFGQGATTVKEDDDYIRHVVFQNASAFELWKNPLRLYSLQTIDGATLNGGKEKKRLYFDSQRKALDAMELYESFGGDTKPLQLCLVKSKSFSYSDQRIPEREDVCEI